MCAVSTIYAKPVEVEDQTTENVEEADENLEIDSFACNTLETKVRYHFAYFLVAVKWESILAKWNKVETALFRVSCKLIWI